MSWQYYTNPHQEVWVLRLDEDAHLSIIKDGWGYTGWFYSNLNSRKIDEFRGELSHIREMQESTLQAFEKLMEGWKKTVDTALADMRDDLMAKGD